MKKSILLTTLVIGSCSPAIAESFVTAAVEDHYKEIINQKHYYLEVFKDVQRSGDKTGDALLGAIIGGIIGNNVTKDLPDGGTAGAIIGGLMGHNNSDAKGGTSTKCRTETRYNEQKATVYSHSTIKFWHEGKELTVKFQK